MDELLVELCRTGNLKPLVLGMKPDEVVKGIGTPSRIKVGQGDDCYQTYRYPGFELWMRCWTDAKHRPDTNNLRLTQCAIDFTGLEPITLPETISPTPIASARGLRIEEAQLFLGERGIPMTRYDYGGLERVTENARIWIGDSSGFVSTIQASWRPGSGRFYSDESMTSW